MLLTDEPTTWPSGPQPSLLHVLLLFGGVPLLITAAIVLMVMAPSLTKSTRSAPGPRSDTGSEWFGDPEARDRVPAGGEQFRLAASGRRIALGAPLPEQPVSARSGETGAHAASVRSVGATASGTVGTGATVAAPDQGADETAASGQDAGATAGGTGGASVRW